jgi:hypothetical protein
VGAPSFFLTLVLLPSYPLMVLVVGETGLSLLWVSGMIQKALTHNVAIGTFSFIGKCSFSSAHDLFSSDHLHTYIFVLWLVKPEFIWYSNWNKNFIKLMEGNLIKNEKFCFSVLYLSIKGALPASQICCKD